MPPSPSPSIFEAKRTMETKVAIIEDDPHRFKLSPLRTVPSGQRDNVSSPSMNFDRPFVGCRLQPPSLYQLAPSRSASIYSFPSVNSVNSENGSIQTQPISPLSVTSFSLNKPNPSNDSSGAGLGLHNLGSSRSVSAGSLAAAANITACEDTGSRSFSSSSSLSSQRSWVSVSPGFDLTFGASDDSSGPCLHTPDPAPLPPSQSSESFRKAKSMHVLASLSCLESPLKLDSKHASSLPRSTSLRHLKAKTVTPFSDEKGESHRHKRHAIYGPGDRRMRLSLSCKDWSPSAPPQTPILAELGSDSSSTSLEPSPSVLAVERKEASRRVSLKNALHVPVSAQRSFRRILDPINPNTSSSAFLCVPPISTTENPTLRPQAPTDAPVVPLKFKRTLNAQTTANPSRYDVVHHHPIIRELLQDIDTAIIEWGAVGSLTNRF
ncbi:uncharacterized protein PHACADRAFT_25157 [Phanerochaete carnosa HHB-10118-sp]|uniref:Uncharacterized protein n=1 Tax=Phanerochaete carnosa (strain HHB-10118-sp) TaxID=650164 RepID=K5W549_PHACS|nr:uncharacterized protein PHACADRAFT_25157 [Phanerochaete carnosa HHB-10118-sp]EKM59028.1 hypothetical protein PHACADRAFT_25157 [Phanerochaete carnosa HHB-10118-sp]